MPPERAIEEEKTTLEGTTSIRIYGTPTPAILEMLGQATGVGVPVPILPEHLGGFTAPGPPYENQR